MGSTTFLINIFAEDETNIHRHARHHAQAAVAAAKKKAQEFDTNAALERKTNEALKLAKRQAHIRADEDVETPGGSGTPLVDRMSSSHCVGTHVLTRFQWTRMS